MLVDRVLVAIFEVDIGVPAIGVEIAGTADGRCVCGGSASLLRGADIPCDGRTAEVVLQDDVHDAGDRIRAVDGRRRVLQDFDPFNGVERDARNIDERALTVVREGKGRHPVAVDQHQRRRCVQAA